MTPGPGSKRQPEAPGRIPPNPEVRDNPKNPEVRVIPPNPEVRDNPKSGLQPGSNNP